MERNSTAPRSFGLFSRTTRAVRYGCCEKLLVYALGRGLEYQDAPRFDRWFTGQKRPITVSSRCYWTCEKHTFYMRASSSPLLNGGNGKGSSNSMIIRKMALPRRSFPRGVGVTVALAVAGCDGSALSAAPVSPAASGIRVHTERRGDVEMAAE